MATNHLVYSATLTEANSLNITFTLQYVQYLHWGINESFLINDAVECICLKDSSLIEVKTMNMASYSSSQLSAGNLLTEDAAPSAYSL